MQQDMGLSFLGGGHYLALAPMDRAGGLEGGHLPPAQAGEEPAQFLGGCPGGSRSRGGRRLPAQGAAV